MPGGMLQRAQERTCECHWLVIQKDLPGSLRVA